MLSEEIDRERMATPQANAELTKKWKARTADSEAARTALLAAQHSLHEEKTSRRDAEAQDERQLKEVEIELATQRERATGAEQRASDLASQLQRQQVQAEREIAQLREAHAATTAALRQVQIGVAES